MLTIGVAGYQRIDRSAVNPQDGFARSTQHRDREKVLVYSPRRTPTLHPVADQQNEPFLSFCPICILGETPAEMAKVELRTELIMKVTPFSVEIGGFSM